MPHSTRRRTVGLLLSALALGALAACSTDDTPAPTPSAPITTETPTPTPTPTPSPTPSLPPERIPPERPDLSTPSTAAAQALAVYFVELYPYTYATGDLNAWNEFSHPECIFCASVREGVEEMHAAGNHSEGGLETVTDAHAVEVSDRWWHVTLRVDEGPSVTVGPDGTIVEEFPGIVTYQFDIAVTLHDGRMVVRGVDHQVIS